MKTFSSFILLLAVFGGNAFGAIRPQYQDAKFPTQQMVEKQAFGSPIASDTVYVINTTAGNTSAAAATLSSFTHSPDVPRNLVITPNGSTGDVASCVVVVNGTNILNQSITESFTFSANATTAQTGAKAFKTVTSVVFPALCEDAPYLATWDIGVGEKLGLKRCMASAGDWLHGSVGGAYEATRATIVADVDEVEKNTADFNGTMDGSAAFIGYFFQNFAQTCQP